MIYIDNDDQKLEEFRKQLIIAAVSGYTGVRDLRYMQDIDGIAEKSIKVADAVIKLLKDEEIRKTQNSKSSGIGLSKSEPPR